jgi:dTDP-glucose 4,6-dehydratase
VLEGLLPATSKSDLMAKKKSSHYRGRGFPWLAPLRKILKEDFHVIAMDNLITGDLRNIEHLFKLQQFEFYHHDVSKFIHVPGELDYILHFASPASPIDYLKIPIQTLK